MVNIVLKFQVPSSNGLESYDGLKIFPETMTQQLNYGGVCRTAPATPFQTMELAIGSIMKEIFPIL